MVTLMVCSLRVTSMCVVCVVVGVVIVSFLRFGFRFVPPNTGDEHNLCKALGFCKRFLKEK